MQGLNDWEEVTDISGITVYFKKVNGYEREVYYNHKINKWCFKKWTRKSSAFPTVGSANTFREAIEYCEEDND